VEGSWLEELNAGLNPPIENLGAGQCVLLVESGVFHVFSHNHDVWFDQLYIRFVPPTKRIRAALRNAFMISGQGSTSFMTAITVQGSGTKPPAGSIGEGILVISSETSRVHMHEAFFKDLKVLEADSAFMKTAGPLSLNRTTFQNVLAPELKAFISVQPSGQLRLADVTFGPNAIGAQVFVESSTPSVWSAQPLQVTNVVTAEVTTAPGLDAIPDPSPFTSLGNKWIQSLITVRSAKIESSHLSSPIRIAFFY
jgi:hypothetical protein